MKQYFLLSFFIFYLVWNTQGQNCTINAGVNNTVCVGQPISLDGSVGGTVNARTLEWSLISQPAGANIIISSTKSLMTSVTNASVVGSYTFRLSAVCGDAGPAQDDVTITVNRVPATPVITGTSNFPCYNGSPINLTGTPPGPGETVSWSVLGGSSGSFGTSTSNTTTFTPTFAIEECSSFSTVTIRYQVFSNGCESSVTRAYTFARNYGLSATANPSQVCGTATVLKGSCPGTGTVAWTQVSGPNTAVIANSASKTTAAAGLIQGTYIFKYTVTGGCSPGTVDVVVNVAGSSAVTPAIAGPDQHYCEIPGVVSLTGNKPAVGETVTWSQLSVPTSTLSAPNNFNTTASMLTGAGSPYTFLYTISNGVCFTVDSVSIYRLPELSLTSSDIDLCGSTLTSGAMFTSSFGYHQLDTVRVNITMLSGPPGISTQPLVRKAVEPGSASPVSQSSPVINVGQTSSWTLAGNDLYFPMTEPVSRRYYLDFPIRINSGAGIFRYRVSVTTRCTTIEKEITVARGYTGSGVNAGTDIALPCKTTSTELAGNLVDSRGLWSTVTLPAGATDPINALNQSLRNPPLNDLIPGTYVFRYSNNTGPSCTANQFDEIKLVVSNTPPPTPVAGADVSTCAGSFQLGGSFAPFDAFANWTVTSPALSGVTFSDPSVANPVINNLQPNVTYTFRYTFNNGCGANSDEVSVTTNSSVSPPKPVISSIALTNCGTLNRALPSSVPITINHPALAAGTSASWSVVSRPSGITLNATPVNATSTNVILQNVSQSTVFSVIYSVTSADCPLVQVSDTLTGYIKKSNELVTSAGANQQLCSVTTYPLTVNMNGTASSGPVLWSQVYSSNGLLANIASPGTSNTTVTIPSDGMYRFKYGVQSPTDASCQGRLGEDIMQITASSPGPVALAGSDISFCNSSGVTALNATAVTTGRWEVYKVTEGNAPTIETVTSATSNLTFHGSGSAILRWSSYGNVLECGPSSSDLVTVTYTAPANAGSDLELCQVSSVNLSALSPGSASGIWLQIGGAPANIATASDPKTLVTGLTNGVYTFRYSVNGAGGCITSDDVTLLISDNSELANAGADRTSCSGGTNSIKLNASAPTPGFTGAWSVLSKPADAPLGSFSNVANPEAIYDGVTQPGKYVFAWATGDGICRSTDYVEYTAGEDPCALPVTLTNFTLLVEEESTLLNWGTTEESGSDRFEIERSNNAKDWTKIGSVISSGKSNVFQSYSFADASPVYGVNYYRLKMIDRDGTFAYSRIRNVTFNNMGKVVRVYPNPASDELHVEIKDWSTIRSINLLDINGRVIHRIKSATPIDIKSLASGIYMMQVTGSDGISNSYKVVIAK